MLSSVRDHCIQLGLNKTYWIAYSGGLDSHALLSICNKLRFELAIKFRVIHINHNLSPYALSWQDHCKKICKEYGFDLIIHAISFELMPGDSLEEAAREKRYAVFSEYLNAGDILLTGHHQDDQAETVLLQLLRGAGVKGLAAMPEIKQFAQGFHCRPFINVSHLELEKYAKEQKLIWIEDESNIQVKYTRNFIRHKIIPLLKARWPSAAATIARSAAHCAESQVLLEEFALDLCSKMQGTRENTLSIAKLMQLSTAKQRLVLRQWIHQSGLPLPNSKKIKTIQQDVFTAAWDSLSCVKWAHAELRRYRDDLYLMEALSKHDPLTTYEWDFTQPLQLARMGQLQVTPVLGKGLRSNLSQVDIRFRQGGEIIDLPNRGRHTLKNLFQEWDVLPWERNRIPLIYAADQLIGVAGYCIAADFAAKSGEMGRELKYLPLKGEG